MRWLAAVLMMAAVLPGCATKVEGLFVRDDFRAREISRGGIMVGGVVAEPGKFDLQQSNDLSNLMGAALQEEREYLRPVPPGALFNALGEKKYSEVMTGFAKADLDQNTLGAIAQNVKEVRYLALAKVDTNFTVKGTSDIQAREYKDKSGKVVKEPGKVVQTHRRTVVVTLTIYDLASRSVAFSGQVTKARDARSEYVRQKDPLALQVVKALVSSDLNAQYPTPEAPQTRDLLRLAFAGFGENLPEGD